MHKRFALIFVFFFNIAFGADPTVKLVSSSFRSGEIFLIVVDGDVKPEQLEGTFLNRPLHFFQGKSKTSLAFVGIDIEDPIGKTPLLIQTHKDVQPHFESSQEITVLRRHFRTQRIAVDPKYVNLTKEDLERDAKEQAELVLLFSGVSPVRFIDGNFELPVQGAPEGVFGTRRIFNGEVRRPHSGEDLAVEIGTPVKASASGKVVLAKEHFFNGNIVVLDHGLGLFSNYVHLSRIDVKVGDQVELGQVVGLSGKTGRVRGACLHWGVKLNEVRIDPYSLKSLNLKPYL